MVHPFMSEWYEWPVMDCHSVPFAATSSGGQLKAQGNPGVWLTAFAYFVACSVFLVGWVLYKVTSLCRSAGGGGASKKGGAKGGKSVPPPRIGVEPAGAEAATPAPAAPADNTPAYEPPQGWVIPFVTLWSGYLLNLVPYMGISRSKFVYHYIPALMVAVLLTALAVEWLWARAGAGRAHAAFRLAAPAITAATYGVVIAGFVYWGIPFGYGVRLPWEGVQARKWNPKW
jgi:amino acid transporter